MRSCIHSACFSLAAILLATAGAAQSVDYAALQETIGEPVTTSVTGKPQRASETPAAIEIITRDQIAHSPAHDVPGLLKTYAGVDVNRWLAGQSDVAVRGGVQTYNPRLLVLVNGHQVYLDHYGMTDWNLIGVQLEEIQQIELVRGPATALFGFNAASAVVNIITISASQGSSLVAAGEIGGRGYDRLSAVATLPIGRAVGLRISAGHQREHELRFPANQAPPADPRGVKRDEVDATLEASPGVRTRLTVNGGYSTNDQLELLPTQIPTRQRYEVMTGGVRADRDTDWGSVTGGVYANWLDAHFGAVHSGVTSFDAVHVKNRIIVAHGSGLIRLGLSNVLRLGVEYRDNRLEGDPLFTPRVDYGVWSGNAMLDLHPTDRLALTFAGRLDHFSLGTAGAMRLPAANELSDYDRHFVRPSFNAAALVQLGGDGQLRINGGLGYQIPSLVDLGLRIPLAPMPGLPPLLLAGSPGFDPVAVWSGEIGYTKPLSPHAKLAVTLFYTKTKDAIASPGVNLTLTPSMVGGISLVSRFVDAGSFRTAGAEVSLAGTIGAHVDWRANYTFTDTNQAIQPIDLVALAPRDTTARHKANVEIGYHRDRWFATTVLRYTSSTRQLSDDPLGNLALFRLNPALAWDQKIGVTLGRATLALTGENLTGARGASGSPIPAGRRIIAGVKVRL
jgi:iron complex outermembrane receptor protein